MLQLFVVDYQSLVVRPLSSATVSDLTSGRVVIAGTSGAIEDSGNLTFNGSQLGITGTVNASSTITGTELQLVFRSAIELHQIRSQVLQHLLLILQR